MGAEIRWILSSLLSTTTILLVFFPLWSHSQNPYCEITKDHTLCKFQGIGPKCKGLYDRGIPSQDREVIMSMHNTMRQLVATGNEKRGKPGPQPSASNMRQMEWDEELASSAQRLADQCKYTHDCLACRKVDRFLTGQNLYQFSENYLRDGSNWPQAINAWYDEVADFSPSSIDAFKFIKALGHFTQMLWADTYRIGCGYAFYNEGKWNRKLYICNYGPAGNIITTPMYQRGAPCSACPEGTYCSNQYPGLCTGGGSSSYSSPVSYVQARPTLPPPPPTTTTIPTTTTRRTTTTRYTTTTTPRPTTTTTTTTTIIPSINYNEIETNELLPIENRFGFPSRKNSQRGRVSNSVTTTKTSLPTTRAPFYSSYYTQPTTTLRPYVRASTTTTRAPSRVYVTYQSPVKNTQVSFTTRIPSTTTRPRIYSNNNNNNNYYNTQRVPTTRATTTRRTTTTTTTTATPSTLAPYYQSQQNTYYNQQQQPAQIDYSQGSGSSSYNLESQLLATLSPATSRFTSASNNFAQAPQTSILRLVDSPVVGIQDMNSILLFCDFDYAKCPIRFTGDSWNYTISETAGFGKGFESVVSPGHITNLYIRSIMNPVGDGNVCLYFRFINYRFSPDGSAAKSGNKPLPLKVTAGTLRQKPKVVEIPDISITPRDWLTARIQFHNLRSMFLLIFQLPTNYLEDNVYVAIDDILVTQGLCHT